MASILKVDDLRGNTAAGNITITSEGGSATMQLQQGLAKAWIVYDQANTNVDNSLNSSSVTDNSTADFTRNHTSSFSSVSYTNTGGGSFNGSDAAGTDALGHRHKAPTTSSVRMLTNYGSSGGALDWEFNSIESNGDLA